MRLSAYYIKPYFKLFSADQQIHLYIYPSNFKIRISAGDKSALGKAAVGGFGGSKARTANAA